MTPCDEAQAFLRDLWGGRSPPGLVAISWAGDGNFRTRTFETVDAAAEFGVQAPGDVYVRVCTLRPSFGGSGRGKATDSWALPALVLDLDVKPKAFVDLGAAWAYLSSLPFAPSLVVESGCGLHAWWVLAELLMLDTAERMAAGVVLADRWRGFCRYEAVKVGADLDAVADLARVLRLPGTVNHKYQPPRTVTLARNTGLRHSLSALTDLLGSLTKQPSKRPGPVPQSDPVGADHGAMTDDDKQWFQQVLALDPRLWRYYSGRWADLVTVGEDGSLQRKYRSASETDYAFLGFLVRYGADDGRAQRIYRSSALMRPKADERRGAGTYLTHTIGRLRSEQQAEGSRDG
jgi:hypothetical protein